jgi:hypothetical protein
MLRRRVWGFLHPRQWVNRAELEWLAQEIRYLLSESSNAVRNAHLTGQERDRRIMKNQQMQEMLDQLLK